MGVHSPFWIELMAEVVRVTPGLEFQDAPMFCPRLLLTPSISWFRMLILIYTRHLIWNNYIFAGMFCNGKLGTNKQQIFAGNAKWLQKSEVSAAI